MKKYLLFLLFVLHLCNLVYAQEEFSPKIGIGGHYGFNYSNVRFEPSIRSRSVEMNSFGMVFYYISEKHLGIQLEANYTERGWESGSDSTFYNQRRMSYMEFPMLSHLTVGGKHLRLIINAGPYLAFLRTSYEGFKVAIPVEDTDKTIVFNPMEYQEQFSAEPKGNLDYGYSLGVGLGFHSIAGDIIIRARYTQGLTNLFPQFPEGTFKFSQMRTLYAGVSYTYEFKLKPKRK